MFFFLNLKLKNCYTKCLNHFESQRKWKTFTVVKLLGGHFPSREAKTPKTAQKSPQFAAERKNRKTVGFISSIFCR